VSDDSSLMFGSRLDATVLHVDMDAFYASVEVLHDPALRGRPVIVGGTGDRGVVASCSYEARVYGVHSAMPSTRARRLCPHAVFLAGRYELYSDYSRRIHEVFKSFTPLVEGIALDEAFLDVSGARRLFGEPAAIAWAIRARIHDELGLRASVGVATTKFVAKLASEAAKPRADRRGTRAGRGVVVVAPGEELAFLHPLPVQALWGVGPATRQRLERFGVRTIGELAALPEDSLVAALGSAVGRQLHQLAWAHDDRAVEPEQQVKSVGHEETYARDHHELAPLKREAVRLADSVASRLRKHDLAGRTVSIKVRFHDFRTITRSRTLPAAVDSGPDIARAAAGLLEHVDPSTGVRLFGVSVSNLIDQRSRQLTLDETDAAGWGGVTAAVDRIRGRFGDRAVGPATLVGDTGLRVKRQGDTQWGPAGPGGHQQSPAGPGGDEVTPEDRHDR
jgi:DNA polymerase-4